MAGVLIDKLDTLDEEGKEWDEEVILILDVLCGKRNFRDHAPKLGYPVEKMVRACQEIGFIWSMLPCTYLKNNLK